MLYRAAHAQFQKKLVSICTFLPSILKNCFPGQYMNVPPPLERDYKTKLRRLLQKPEVFLYSQALKSQIHRGFMLSIIHHEKPLAFSLFSWIPRLLSALRCKLNKKIKNLPKNQTNFYTKIKIVVNFGSAIHLLHILLWSTLMIKLVILS